MITLPTKFTPWFDRTPMLRQVMVTVFALALAPLLTGCPPESLLKNPEGKPELPVAVITQFENSWFTDEWQRGVYGTLTLRKGYAPFPVFLEGWRSTPREDIASYVWDFGDGSPLSRGFNGAHVYEVPGTYTATLTVTDVHNQTSVAYIEIQVLEPDGTTYYVDAELGDDENDGTSPGTGAWRTARKAFNGLTNGRYRPGDQILFKRGQVFSLPHGVRANHIRGAHGYTFGAYGEGGKPLIQYTGGPGVQLLDAGGRGFVFIGFRDLAFDLQSDTGDRASFFQLTGDHQNVLFHRIEVNHFGHGIAMQGPGRGYFIVDCDLHDSEVVQVYSTAGRVAILNSSFDYSGNHLAYLSTVQCGLIKGNRFTRPAFGRHALRLSGRYTTHNVHILENEFIGWIDPRNGDSSRYNWLLVQLAPNDWVLQIMRDVIFEDNVLRDAETLLSIGSYENLVVRGNTMSSADTEGIGSRIMLGSKHNNDFRPLQNVSVVNNHITVTNTNFRQAPIFDIIDYTGPEYEGLTQHKNIKVANNTVVMDGSPVRLVILRNNVPGLMSELTLDNQVVHVNDADAHEFFQVGGTFAFGGGTRYTLAQWRDLTGKDLHSRLRALSNLPHAGWATSPEAVVEAPIHVQYMGAHDNSGTGLRRVHLYVKRNGGPWMDSKLWSVEPEGTFEFRPPVSDRMVTYSFAMRAEDMAGNMSPMPDGEGDTQTVYWPLSVFERVQAGQK